MSSVSASATIGATVQVNVDITLSAVTSNQVQEACNSVAKQFHKDEQYQKDQTQYGVGGGLGFVFGLFGIFGGGGYQKNS